MPKIKIKCQKGLTLIELIMAMLISIIIILGVAVLLVDSLKGWNRMYSKLHGQINSSNPSQSASLDDAYVARLIFDRIVRKASIAGLITDQYGNPTPLPPTVSHSFKIYYYPDSDRTPASTFTNPSYSATFIWDPGTKILTITYGPTGGKTTYQVQDVTDCVFNQSGPGRVVQMILTLQYKDTQTFQVASTAFLNCN